MQPGVIERSKCAGLDREPVVTLLGDGTGKDLEGCSREVQERTARRSERLRNQREGWLFSIECKPGLLTRFWCWSASVTKLSKSLR